jgi:hypothetical protein
MDHDNAPDSHGSAGPGRPDPGKAVLAVNGVIAALAVTVVAGCVGLACAALVAWKK